MSQERLQKMVELLKTHRVVPRQTFLDRFEISPANFTRDLEYLRDRLGAPERARWVATETWHPQQ